VDEKHKETAERYLHNLTEEVKKKGFKATSMVKTGQQVAVEIIDLQRRAAWISLSCAPTAVPGSPDGSLAA
jgi:ribosomal protein S1